MLVGKKLLLAQPLHVHHRAPPLALHPVRRALVQRHRRRDQLALDAHQLPGREPVAPAPVGANPHQLRRGFHLCHDRRELLGAVALPVDQPRQVVPAERALLLRQRLQHQLRLGQQPFAVAPRDRPVLIRPFGVLAARRPPRPGRADLVLWLQVQRARGVRAMVDPHVVPKSASRALTSSAQRSRQVRSSARSFHARSFSPNPACSDSAASCRRSPSRKRAAAISRARRPDAPSASGR